MSAWDDQSAPHLAFPVPEANPSWSQPSSAFPSYKPFPLPPVPGGYQAEEEDAPKGFFDRIPPALVVVLGGMVGVLLAVGIIAGLNPSHETVSHRSPSTMAKDVTPGVVVKPVLAPLYGTVPSVADVNSTSTPSHRRAVAHPPARRAPVGGRPINLLSVGIGG